MRLRLFDFRDDDAAEVAVMVGELLAEIVAAVGEAVFNVDLAQTETRLHEFLRHGHYIVFVARTETGAPLAFWPCTWAMRYTHEGAFGTIPELHVRPSYRSQGVGRQLLEQACVTAKAKVELAWKPPRRRCSRSNRPWRFTSAKAFRLPAVGS